MPAVVVVPIVNPPAIVPVINRRGVNNRLGIIRRAISVAIVAAGGIIRGRAISVTVAASIPVASVTISHRKSEPNSD